MVGDGMTDVGDRYYIRTWDHHLQRWTPQEGVSLGAYTLMGLRHAIKALRGMGYPFSRDEAENCVLIEKWDSDQDDLRRCIAEDYQARKKAYRERAKSYKEQGKSEPKAKPKKAAKQKELFA